MHTCNHFCNRMFHLEPSVHLHEVKVQLFIHNKLYGAGTDIIHGLCRSDGSLAQFAPDLPGQSGSWGLLDDLLVPALDRTVTLKQVDIVTMLVSKYLNTTKL